jgi:hypothetical protein
VKLRYMGFDQHDNTRGYKFDGVENGQLIVQFVVSADLTLFLRHRVNIQDGPSLFACKLGTDFAELGPRNHQLTNEDLLAFTTARAAAEARKAELRSPDRRRRFPPRPGTPGGVSLAVFFYVFHKGQ